MVNFQTAIQDMNPLSGMDYNQLLAKGILGVIIFVIGIVLGKLIGIALTKLSTKLELSKHIRQSFIDLFIVIIKWSIYLIFLNLAITRLGISSLTNFFSAILLAIPAFTGAIILLSIGFVIARYLREVIEDAEIDGWEIISKIIFYFVIYIFTIYALRTALISLNSETIKWIIIVITGAVAFVVANKLVMKEKRNN